MDEQPNTAESWLATHREQIPEAEPVEVDVFVRSLSPPLGVRERQEQLLEQLSELQSSGVIDAYRVNLWGGGVCLCDVCSGVSVAESMLDNVADFEEWAAEKDDVELPFERTTVESELAERTVRDLEVPAICLGVYSDSMLSGVFPCQVADQQITVTDYVDTLAEEGVVETVSESRDSAVQI
jgi:hypothetical protein